MADENSEAHPLQQFELDPEQEVLQRPGVKALDAIITRPPDLTPQEKQKLLLADPTNGWTQRIEIYVSSISSKCKSYRNIHEASTIHYDKQGGRFTIFLIFVSFLVSAISLVPFFNGPVFKYVIALLSVLNTTLATVNKFLKYQELSTRHRLASQKFLELHRGITEQFLLPVTDRTNGKSYVSSVGRAFDQIMKSAPYPPEVVKTKIKMTFTPDNDVNVPSYLDPSATVIAVSDADVPAAVTPPTDTAPPTVHATNPENQIHSVNPEAGATETALPPGGLSALARFQLQRARYDLDSYSGDYD